MGWGTLAVTGAAGTIGTVMRHALRGESERMLLLDRVPLRAETPDELTRTVDLLDAAAMESALSGADSVLHLGGIPDEAPLPDLLQANLLGTHHVLEAARRTGVRRVVMASSNRVTGFYPTGHRTRPDEPVRPDGLYGVSKAALEALGRLYADKFGLSVICLRIGTFRDAPAAPRDLATWLSPRDAVGFVRAALNAPPSVGFAVAYAVSANTRRFWELPDTSVLDYTPVDDAEHHAAGSAGGGDVPAGPADPSEPQGGPFALPEFTLRYLETERPPG